MTTAIAEIAKGAPLPASVDSQADSFHQLELEIGEAKLKLTGLQKQISAREHELIELIRAFGGPHAQKSKILHGIVWEMIATFSQYIAQDSAAIERFRLELVKSKQTRLLKKIFSSDVRWTMKASAAEIVKTEKLSLKLMSLLLLCSVTQDKKPSLDVRPKKKPAA